MKDPQYKKLKVMCLGVAIVAILGFLGLKIEYIKIIAKLIMMYIFGQGMADFGKEGKK